MFPVSEQLDDEGRLVELCQQGDGEALTLLRGRHHEALMNILVARGANPGDAAEALAEVWARCVAGGEEHPSILEKFNGKCRLQNWLCRVAINRWLDSKRREKFMADVPASPQGETTFFGKVPAPPANDLDGRLVGLLRDSLAAAFGRCSPEAIVLLRLVYNHGLTQREIMRMVGWSEAKVSRTLSHAMEEIKEQTLTELKKRDQWLQPTWEDFLDMCAIEPLGFL
jgi:RNA polymerase sigma factor (sigma-70 family)